MDTRKIILFLLLSLSFSYLIAQPLAITKNVTQIGCNGTTGSATISGTGGLAPYTYEWKDFNGIVFSTNPSQANLSRGAYFVTVTDANTCKGIDEKSVKTKVCPNAINTIKIPGLKVQPNPAFNKLNIEWLAHGKGASLTLFDIRGTKIFEQQAEPGLGQYSIDVSQYSRGIYYLKVTTEAASQSIKIVLE